MRYQDPEGRVGYYTPDGVSAQAAFLRSPVEFSQVGSRFSRARRHPVLQRVRAHRGVDYAAPVGTADRRFRPLICQAATVSWGREIVAGPAGTRVARSPIDTR